MDINELNRDGKYILQYLKELPNGSVVTTKDTIIQIPCRFTERNLAEVGAEIYITGIYAIIMDKKYGVSRINAQLQITPSKILKIDINDTYYYEFYFEANSQIFATTNLVKKDTLVYYIFEEFISKANIPWYINYDDLGKLLDTANYHANTNVADNQELAEMIISLIARDSIDKTVFYRTTISSYEYVRSRPASYISLSDVVYGASSTMNKIIGSYLESGICSALVNPSSRVERVESLLRA